MSSTHRIAVDIPRSSHVEKAHGANSPRSFWSHSRPAEIQKESSISTHWTHPTLGGRISVHNESLNRDVFQQSGGNEREQNSVPAAFSASFLPDISNHNSRTPTKRGGNMSLKLDSAPSTPLNLPKISKHSITREWDDPEAKQRRAVAHEKKEENSFMQSMSRLHDGHNTIVKSVDDMLRNREIEQSRKKELLFKEWQSKVYDPLQSQIQTQLDSLPSIFSKNAAKSSCASPKGETSSPDSSPPRKIRYKLHAEDDPTLFSQNKLNAERAMKGDSPVQLPRLRDTLDPKMWAPGMLEATPYGERSPKKSDPTMRSSINQASVCFDDYGSESPRSEGKTGRKVYPDRSKSNVMF
eukprot:TRINITY_DN221_c0_g3_i1.p1 TRINITY_DN221_c0_g3~~TRINITY_DN221_c0_g3_i1.p1  ORF type:complete len:353 (+),score=72.83 TRINITY_DN221_c0_g3_i1:63-1121(+)